MWRRPALGSLHTAQACDCVSRFRGVFAHSYKRCRPRLFLRALMDVEAARAGLHYRALPSGATNVIGFAYSLLLSYWFLAGMTCYAVSIGSWMIVLAKTEVSLAYPLLSIGYIMTAIVGYYFLGENVNLARIGGIALICFGTLLISRSA